MEEPKREAARERLDVWWLCLLGRSAGTGRFRDIRVAPQMIQKLLIGLSLLGAKALFPQSRAAANSAAILLFSADPLTKKRFTFKSDYYCNLIPGPCFEIRLTVLSVPLSP